MIYRADDQNVQIGFAGLINAPLVYAYQIHRNRHEIDTFLYHGEIAYQILDVRFLSLEYILSQPQRSSNLTTYDILEGPKVTYGATNCLADDHQMAGVEGTICAAPQRQCDCDICSTSSLEEVDLHLTGNILWGRKSQNLKSRQKLRCDFENRREMFIGEFPHELVEVYPFWRSCLLLQPRKECVYDVQRHVRSAAKERETGQRTSNPQQLPELCIVQHPRDYSPHCQTWKERTIGSCEVNVREHRCKSLQLLWSSP